MPRSPVKKRTFKLDDYCTKGMAPTASKDNPIFPRKRTSITDEQWGLKCSMLPLRYSTKRPPGPALLPAPPVVDSQSWDTQGSACNPPIPILSSGSVGTRYNCFDWFQDAAAERLALKRCAAKEKRKEPLSIPQDDDPAKKRYPYRYSSAGPCFSGRTGKETDLRRCRRLIDPAVAPQVKAPVPGHTFQWADVFEPDNYETTSLQASLAPLVHRERRKRLTPMLGNHTIPKGSLTRLKLPFKAQTEFDQYVLANTREKEIRDIFNKRKITFVARDSDLRPKWNNIWHIPLPSYVKNKKDTRKVTIKSKRDRPR